MLLRWRISVHIPIIAAGVHIYVCMKPIERNIEYRHFNNKLVGIDWSLLNSSSYTHCFLLIGAKI